MYTSETVKSVICLLCSVAVVGVRCYLFEYDVVSSAFDDAHSRHQSELRIFVKIRYVQDSAVAHSRSDFVERHLNVVVERSGVRHI